MLFLIGPLLASSQKLSVQDSSCVVPCYTLRNALIVKADHDYLKDQIQVVRDSVGALNLIVDDQNSIITLQNETISLLKQNEKTLIGIIENKDKEIELHKKEIRKQKLHKTIAYIVSAASMVFGVYMIL
jgi:hypothetical protein